MNMKKLHLFMLKSFVGPFFATFFIAMFVLIMQFLWRMIDDIVGKGLEFSVLAELILYMATSLVHMALPLAVLLSSIMTFGALGENYELTALKAAGISLYRIMKPLIILIVFITASAFIFANNILPVANLKLYTLLYDIRKAKPEMAFKEGIFTNDLEGYSIKIDRINKETGMMYDLLIYSHDEGSGNYEVTMADSGYMYTLPGQNIMQLTLFHGSTYTDESVNRIEKRKTFPFRRITFDSQVAMIPLPDSDLKRSDEDGLRSHARMLNLTQLDVAVDSITGLVDQRQDDDVKKLLKTNYLKSKVIATRRDSILTAQGEENPLRYDSLMEVLEVEQYENVIVKALEYARDVHQENTNDKMYYLAQGESIRKHKVEWHKKFTLAFACFIFFFIGAPLGAIIRKGGLGMPLVVSVFLFIMYYIISMMGERSAAEAVLTPLVGTWISSLVLLVLGIFLTYKSVTDSELLNPESYYRMYVKVKHIAQKIVRKFKKSN